MADIEKFIPFLLKWEGTYVNDPADPGGATMLGVSFKTWKKLGYDKNQDGVIDEKDIALINKQDMTERILKPHYWDAWRADEIQNQLVANMVVDWLWCSGTRSITITQRLLGVTADGIVGNQTLTALNAFPDQDLLCCMIHKSRVFYTDQICNLNPKLNRFKKGWLNRIQDLSAHLYITLLLLVLICSLLCCSCRTARVQTQYADQAQHHMQQADSMQMWTVNKEQMQLQDVERVETDSSFMQLFFTFQLAHDSIQTYPVQVPTSIQGIYQKSHVVQQKVLHTQKERHDLQAASTAHKVSASDSLIIDGSTTQVQDKHVDRKFGFIRRIALFCIVLSLGFCLLVLCKYLFRSVSFRKNS